MRGVLALGVVLAFASSARAQVTLRRSGDVPEPVEAWLPEGTTERFTAAELCDRAARTGEARTWAWEHADDWIECAFEPSGTDGFSVAHMRLPGGELLVLLEGEASALRVVTTLHRCYAGPGANSSCGTQLLGVHHAAHRGQTVVSFETESDMFDYDAEAGVQIWHRQLTVCTWRASSADAVCTARVPLGLRHSYFSLPPVDAPNAWERTVVDETELEAIAVVRRDGTVRLRAREGPLDNLSSWFGWRCGIGDDVTLPWDPALATEASDPLRAAWQPAWWPPRALPSHLDPARVEALGPRCPD